MATRLAVIVSLALALAGGYTTRAAQEPTGTQAEAAAGQQGPKLLISGVVWSTARSTSPVAARTLPVSLSWKYAPVMLTPTSGAPR